MREEAAKRNVSASKLLTKMTSEFASSSVKLEAQLGNFERGGGSGRKDEIIHGLSSQV